MSDDELIEPSAMLVWPPAARAFQARFGSRRAYAAADRRGFRQDVDADLAAFLAQANSFYLASATADAKPYIQHRGGPPGFLKPIGPSTLAFADFSGNRQYITIGRLSENDAVALFLMDYAHQARIKIWGRARMVENDPELIARLADPNYRARIERAIVIEIDAWDENCRQHIPQKFDASDVASAIGRLEARIGELEAENARLKGPSQ
jgi:predicted pyridoxine 5'-phosphate oxidase superfamily flavin-nucleotide-binding protein